MRRLATLFSILALASLTSTPAQAQWTQDSLSTARQTVAAVNVNGKALFSSGRSGNTVIGRVDILDTASNTWTQFDRTARTSIGATVVGNFALFAGGALSQTSVTDLVDIYDGLTGLWSQTTLSAARADLAAATLGTRTFFAGGGNATAALGNIDIYDSSLGAPTNPAAWSTWTLTVPRVGLAVATVGNRILFAGGLTGTLPTQIPSDQVDIYDSSLGAPTNPAAWSTASLSQARFLSHGGKGAGTHAFFAGGMTAPGVMSNVIDIYDSSLGAPSNPTAWSTKTLSSPRALLSPVVIDQRVLFAGGAGNGFVNSATVDVYDEQNGVWLPPMTLSLARSDMGVTAVGIVLYFAGGFISGGASTRVDVYDGRVPTSFCFGDGTGTACPCGNGTAGNGCPSSVNANGANLAASGLASTAADTLVLSGAGMPNSSALYFQGTTHVGAGAVFGDGLLCAGGALTRLGVTFNVAGASTIPGAGDPSISVLGSVTSPGIRTYQVWYRDAADFCTTQTFNLTHGLSVTWMQ